MLRDTNFCCKDHASNLCLDYCIFRWKYEHDLGSCTQNEGMFLIILTGNDHQDEVGVGIVGQCNLKQHRGLCRCEGVGALLCHWCKAVICSDEGSAGCGNRSHDVQSSPGHMN